jgi:3'-5' exonuclease
MKPNVMVWDLETYPDLQGFAAVNYLVGKTDTEVRELMGDKFPKHIYHSIACIGALIAHRANDHWAVDAIGAPHIGDRTEKELIEAFVAKIAELKPQLVTFNGNTFDLPVLRYRGMTHGVAAPGLAARPYFNRFADDAVDLCDVLASFSSQARASLHEICKVIGLSGKPAGIHGGEVERYILEGRIKEVAHYYLSIVLNEYFEEDGATVFREACRLGCEGIVSKKLGSIYRSGRSPLWLKVKNPNAPAVRREAEEDWGR